MVQIVDTARDIMGRQGNPGPGQVTTAAGITRDQWQNFLEFYRPLEDEVLQSAMQTDFSAEGDEAGSIAAGAVRAGRGTLERNLRRSGGTLTAEERRAVNRRTGSTLARSVARAENTTRRSLSDSRTNLLSSIVQIGRGVSGTASSGLNSVADMAAQRESLYQQQRAQAQNSNLSAGASLAGLLLAGI